MRVVLGCSFRCSVNCECTERTRDHDDIELRDARLSAATRDPCLDVAAVVSHLAERVPNWPPSLRSPISQRVDTATAALRNVVEFHLLVARRWCTQPVGAAGWKSHAAADHGARLMRRPGGSGCSPGSVSSIASWRKCIGQYNPAAIRRQFATQQRATRCSSCSSSSWLRSIISRSRLRNDHRCECRHVPAMQRAYIRRVPLLVVERQPRERVSRVWVTWRPVRAGDEPACA